MRYQAALRPECSTNTADKTKFKGYNSYKFLIFLVFNAIKDFMIIECPNCNKKFNIAKNLIPDSGRDLKCSSCGHIWHYEVDTIFETKTSKLLNEDNKEIEIAKSETENEEIEKDESETNNKEIETDEFEINGKEIDIDKPQIYNKNTLTNKKVVKESKEKINKKKPILKKDKKLIVKDKKENVKANQGFKIILVYFLVIIISLLAIILLADTFKSQIINLFPNLIPLFDSFYETLLDLKLFLIDLTN